MSRPDHIKLDQHETNDLLKCLIRAQDLAEDTDNLDVVAMAGAAMDMLIAKWKERPDG